MSNLPWQQIVATSIIGGFFGSLFAFLGFFINNRVNEMFQKKTKVEDNMQQFTLEVIKTAIRQELKEEIRDQLGQVKIDLGNISSTLNLIRLDVEEIKRNQACLSFEGSGDRNPSHQIATK